MAFRLGLDAAAVVAAVSHGEITAEADQGFVVLRVRPGALAEAIVRDPDYGVVAGVPAVELEDRPRVFENPGFSLRYAYARATAVQRRAADFGIQGGPAEPAGDELPLIQALGEMPGWARSAARKRDGRLLARALFQMADAYHTVHEHCPALPAGEKPSAVHASRVTIAAAAGIALRNGLTMIGETPRERI
ncbi:DALR anticodon-binding domain-containing protein [Actinomadura logoneensis]|uniref:DALR anticodon-binding domain-containing protein n=1 Tax=Actinomadura logoneensis TaxID=2293572 RepID=UPI0011C17079|nr:DALR anticodon-binding domain-containing protein [Actinomadura logoneensis]